MKGQILVTGANGQLGNELRKLGISSNDLEFVFTDLPDLDLSDKSALFKYVSALNLKAIINCAAYTAVDQAEDEEALAFQINAEAPMFLAEVAEENAIPLVHISTDYVFGGKAYIPYRETDHCSPIGVYGRSKYAGEQNVISNCKKHYIIRTSWLYSSFGKNFFLTMLRLTQDKDQLRVISDQVGTPTYAGDLAEFILRNLNQMLEGSVNPGVYHFSNEGVGSWYDFAKEIARISQRDCEILPIETKDYPTKAERPHYSVLNKAKITQSFNYSIPHWIDSLNQCYQDQNTNKND